MGIIDFMINFYISVDLVICYASFKFYYVHEYS